MKKYHYQPNNLPYFAGFLMGAVALYFLYMAFTAKVNVIVPLVGAAIFAFMSIRGFMILDKQNSQPFAILTEKGLALDFNKTQLEWSDIEQIFLEQGAGGYSYVNIIIKEEKRKQGSKHLRAKYSYPLSVIKEGSAFVQEVNSILNQGVFQKSD